MVSRALKKKQRKCTQHDCHEEAIGKAWFDERGKWYPYCRKHLEAWEKLGCPIKLFFDTDVVYDEEEN